MNSSEDYEDDPFNYQPLKRKRIPGSSPGSSRVKTPRRGAPRRATQTQSKVQKSRTPVAGSSQRNKVQSRVDNNNTTRKPNNVKNPQQSGANRVFGALNPNHQSAKSKARQVIESKPLRKNLTTPELKKLDGK